MAYMRPFDGEMFQASFAEVQAFASLGSHLLILGKLEQAGDDCRGCDLMSHQGVVYLQFHLLKGL